MTRLLIRGNRWRLVASQGFTKELLLAIPHPAEGGKCNLSRMRRYDNIVTTAAKLHAQAINMLLEFHTSSGPLQHVLLDEPTNHPVKTRSQCTTPSVLLETGVLDKITWICFTFSIYRTSSTAQGGGGSFKNRKPIGEIGCCESGMAERIHWWTEGCLRSPLFLSLSLTIYLPTNLSSMYLSIDRSTYLSLSLFHLITYLPIYLSICLSIFLSIYLSICLSIYLSIYPSFYPPIYLSIHLSICLSVYLSICGAVSFSVR